MLFLILVIGQRIYFISNIITFISLAISITTIIINHIFSIAVLGEKYIPTNNTFMHFSNISNVLS